MSRILRDALQGAWGCSLVLLLSCAVFAQEKTNPDLKLVGDGYLGDAALFMMVRTKPGLTEKEILETLKRGLKISLCHIDGEPVIRSVRASIYEDFENLINQTVISSNPIAEAPLIPRLIPARETLWEFRLKESTDILKKLKVTYKKAGLREYEPKDPRTEPGAPLTLTALGRYALRPEPGDEASSYEATVASLGKKDEVVSQAWPESDRFFVITLRNFKGNRKLLFATIQDGKQVPNPLTHVRLGPDLTFVFANLGIDAPEPGDPVDGNVLKTRVLGIRDRNVRRVWMLFPLSEENYLAKRDEYRKFDSEQLSREIRKNQNPFNVLIEIGPSSEARWLELGDMGARQLFGRDIPLKDIDKLREKYPRAWRLLVWEFDDGVSPPAAIGIMHAKDGRVFLREDELPQWGPELKKALNKQK